MKKVKLRDELYPESWILKKVHDSGVFLYVFSDIFSLY